ncbi:MAG: phage portal protein, partial [Saprospirales bacterium]|nr:phage portal protein [Saprospirales bacterium]
MANIFQRFMGIFSNSAANAGKGNPLENPANPLSSETLGALGSGNSQFPVDEQTSLAVTSFFRAITILSGVIASLPISVFKINSDDSVKKRREHAITRLLNLRPSENITRYNFFQTAVLHLLTFGNFYALIDRSARNQGLATSMQILNPMQMTVKITKKGKPVYEYKTEAEDGKTTSTPYAADRIIHISGLSWDGIRGIGIVDTFEGILGTALANQGFIEFFYSN